VRRKLSATLKGAHNPSTTGGVTRPLLACAKRLGAQLFWLEHSPSIIGATQKRRGNVSDNFFSVISVLCCLGLIATIDRPFNGAEQIFSVITRGNANPADHLCLVFLTTSPTPHFAICQSGQRIHILFGVTDDVQPKCDLCLPAPTRLPSVADLSRQLSFRPVPAIGPSAA
jgi:hypothetical protein